MIRITRLALLAVFLLLFGVVFPVSGWPAGLWWLLLLPIVAAAWVLRVQTTVDDDGLRLRGLIRSRSLPWSQIKGVRFPKRGFARAVLTDGSEATLPAVGFDRLGELARHSRGHIPDPYAVPPTTPAESTGDDSSSSEVDPQA